MAALAICVALATPPAGADPERMIPPTRLPTIAARAASAAGFAPPGWQVERELKGDLNRDGRADLVIVLRGKDPKCVLTPRGAAGPLDTNPRLLVVAFGQPTGYARHLVNAKVIPRHDDPYMDDPLEIGDLTLRDGTIRLLLGNFRSAGGWTTNNATLTFRWSGRGFAMIGYDSTYVQRNSGETGATSVNFLTRRVRQTTGSMEDGVDDKTRWRTLPAQAVPTLETIGDGLMYQPKR